MFTSCFPYILFNHMFTIFDPYLLLGGVKFNIYYIKKKQGIHFFQGKFDCNLKFCDESVDHLLDDNKNTHKLTLRGIIF